MTTVAPVVREQVLISEDQTFAEGVVIPADESWVLDPEASITLTASGNVEVLGELVMQPSSGDVEHVLRFEDVDEEAFEGGGMDPIGSDVGLWVMGDGQLVLEGEEKTSWSYEYDPAWAGDEVVAAPNTPGDYTSFEPVTATPPVNQLGYPTELLNLTRNVRIEGTPEGYTHVFVRSTKPQTIRFTQIRYVAPTVGESDATGRYGLHIHMSGDGSRGSIVEGVVIRDAGNHAFVPHASHDITFRDTIAYNVLNEAYWWDEPVDRDDVANDTHDLIWDRAVAAGVDLGIPGNRFRLAAFYLGNGDNVAITNSVAVGVQGEGGGDRSGFIWPEKAESVWLFENNVAHNNASNGIFVWQNNRDRHDVTRFTAYYNEGAGVNHGAYGNAYQYTDLTLLENGNAVISHALGEANEVSSTQTWTDIVSGGGVLIIDEHAREPEVPVLFVRCDFSQVIVEDEDGSEPSEYDFVDCDLEPDDFDLDEADSDGVFRVQRADGTAYELRGDGAVTDIDAFYG
ncbi:MAG TPA: hypothetical protein VMS99_16360 [Acidimicrobiia bacterium]|nr:hypothetical protein [Acidimicrobiia bacterium]